MIPECAIIVAVSALVLDILSGDPPSRYHPTAWVGRIYGKIIPYFKTGKIRTETALGAAAIITVCSIVASLLFALEYTVSVLLDGAVMMLVLVISGTLLLKSTIAVRGMQEHAIRVIESLDTGDIKCARGNLAMIVKRNTGNLEHKHLVSGTLESISENIGPMFYFAASLLFALEYTVSVLLDGAVMMLVLVISGTLLLKSTIAVRGMQEHAIRVIESLDTGDIKCARGNLAMIVKRNTGNLEHKHLVSGTLESISENISDGITGPMFYFAFFGLPGAFVYRAVNTADSMIGYKNGIFSNLGRFARRMRYSGGSPESMSSTTQILPQ